jgi:hypothetical protein
MSTQNSQSEVHGATQTGNDHTGDDDELTESDLRLLQERDNPAAYVLDAFLKT